MKVGAVYLARPSSLLEIRTFNDTTVFLRPLSFQTERTETNNLIVLGKISQDCIDTLTNISIQFTEKAFKHVRFISRVEVGCLNNKVISSDRSSLTNERYLEESNSGVSLGGELIEWRASPDNYSFGVGFGFNAYFSTITSTKKDTIVSRISTKELIFNLRVDLPLQFIHNSLKDLSLRIYAPLPFFLLSSGSLSPGLNDEVTLKPYIAFGLNYKLSKWSIIELKNTFENCESYSTTIQANTKINYNMIKSELIFSLINIYDNISELISE